MKDEANDINILSLDTSSKNSSISIARGTEIITEYNFVSDNQLSSMLIPAIEFVLNTAKLKLTDIDVFGVGIGPGVFTGIRIGLSTLKGLIYGKKTPVLPVITLKAIAYKYNQANTLLIPLINAKRDEVFIGGYEFTNGSLKEIIAPDLIHISDLKPKLKNFNHFRFIGDGVDIFKEYLKEDFPNSKLIFRSSFLATEICRISLQEYLAQNYNMDLKTIKPFYMRKPDAETKIERNQDKNSKNPQ